MSKPLKRLNRIASRIGACVEYVDGMYRVYFFNKNSTFEFDNPNETKGFLIEPHFDNIVVDGVYEDDDEMMQERYRSWKYHG